MTSWVGDDNVAMLTDFYELTMAQAYAAAGDLAPATFELFVRRLPPRRSFLVACGLADALAGLESFRFGPESLSYLASLDRFSAGFLDYLESFRFTGEVWAVPEGEIVFPNEPILRVTAPLPEAQLVETFLLNTIGFQTMIASKAARVSLACRGRPFIDFSARRDHGADAALRAARAAFVGGAAATSLALAGQVYGIPVTGTMAHSYVMSHEDEEAAFREYGRMFPDDAVFLVDTYDTVAGARIAARVATELASEGIAVRGVRLDSGDVGALAGRVREILDSAGHAGIRIIVSGDMDEDRIDELLDAGSPIDSFGVGTRLGTSADAPYLGVVYKLVEGPGGPVAKSSPGKVTLPGRKQVWRAPDHDVIAMEDEPVAGARPLLKRVMNRGSTTAVMEPLGELQERRAMSVGALPESLRSLAGGGTPYDVRVSPGLRSLADRVTR